MDKCVKSETTSAADLPVIKLIRRLWPTFSSKQVLIASTSGKTMDALLLTLSVPIPYK